MACCEGHVTLLDLDHADNDPALADCCRRDLEQQAKSAKLKAQLRQVDRTTERLRLERSVLVTDRAPADAYASVCCEHHGTDACCHVPELQRLREARLRELRAAAQRQQDAASLQYGVLHEVPQPDALGLLQLAKLCVCHMPGSPQEVAREMDQLLQLLAHAHSQTLFVRAPFERHSPLARHCRMPGPGLVCLQSGKPISAGPPDAFTSDSGRLDGDALVTWLTQSGVLAADGGAAGAVAQPSRALQDSEASDADDWHVPCTVCGRRYPHEHVSAAGDGAASDADGDF